MPLPKPRPYQEEIIKVAKEVGNTMVILPTGTGKTLVAFYLMAEAGHGLMMAPTKPLIEQHYNNFIKSFPSEDCALITGEIPAKKRGELYLKRWVFATPQTVANDIKNAIFDHTAFDLVVFDECHRAVGDYAYAKIAKALPSSIKILGLTASPGSKKERIMEVVNNLRINAIEIRTEEDLEQFLAKKDFRKLFVALPPEMLQIRLKLKAVYSEYKEKLNKAGLYVPFKKGELMALGNKIMAMNSDAKFGLIKLYVGILHAQHMLELLETQGLSSFLNYALSLAKEGKKSVRPLLNNENFMEALTLAREALKKGLEHPKINKLLEVLKLFKNRQVIVFVQYTDNIKKILSILKEKGFKAESFMGKRHGFNKAKQREIMDRFRAGEFNVLVSSSIGEEGIDVPSVDAVIFYEPIPSEIRSIQRKGRTGRVRAGEVIMLITKGTRDEGYFYASSKGEKRMKYIIEQIQRDIRKTLSSKGKRLTPNGRGNEASSSKGDSSNQSKDNSSKDEKDRKVKDKEKDKDKHKKSDAKLDEVSSNKASPKIKKISDWL